MRRPIEMQPLGNMQSRFKPQRVPSSTCPQKVGPAQPGTVGVVDYNTAYEMSPTDKLLADAVQGWSEDEWAYHMNTPNDPYIEALEQPY